jgi:two-component system chemotaxis sensor kinase CheA
MVFETDKFKDIFISEGEERISTIIKILLEIEKQAGNDEQFAELMRSAHTIKGSAATMGYTEIAQLAHVLEDIFHAAERSAIKIDSSLTTTLLSSVDALTQSFAIIKSGGSELPLSSHVEILRQVLTHPKSSIEKVDTSGESGSMIFAPISAPSVVKVSIDRLDALMGIFEELLMLRLKLGASIESGLEIARSTTDGSLKQKLHFVHELNSLLGEMSKLLSENQDALLTTRLVPLEHIFGQYPRMIRDLAVREGKKVEFTIHGGDIALDRMVVDGLGGALAHLLRNAVDHGIVESGTILLTASRERGRARIIVEDNGSGIDYARVREVAISREVDTKEHIDAMNERALAEIIFHPNMSTNNEVTDVSGRGVGVSAVYVFARDIGGRLEVLSPIPEIGRGTRFTLDLPISLATVRVLMVLSGGYTFAIPFESILRTQEFRESEVTSAAHQETIFIDDEVVPLLRLEKILGLSLHSAFNSSSKDTQLAVLIQGKRTRVMLHVEACAGEQDLLVKSLPSVLHGIKGFSGSALLPDGRTILLIDALGLLAHVEGDILEHALV